VANQRDANDLEFRIDPLLMFMDPHSPFMIVNELLDEFSDPIDILMAAEEGDENAQEMVQCLHLDRRSESRFLPVIPSLQGGSMVLSLASSGG
jgi:hypothetical protein